MRARIAPQPAETPRPLKLDEIRARLNTLPGKPAAKGTGGGQCAGVDGPRGASRPRAARRRCEGARRCRTRHAAAPFSPGRRRQPPSRSRRVEQRLNRSPSNSPPLRPSARSREGSGAGFRRFARFPRNQRAIDDRAETLAMRRDQKALSAAMAALRADLGGLTDQVSAISRVGAEQHGAFFEMAQRIDTMAQERPLDRSLIAAIRGDLETMRGMVEGTARAVAVRRHRGAARWLCLAARRHPAFAARPGEARRTRRSARGHCGNPSSPTTARAPWLVSRCGCPNSAARSRAALASRNAPREPDPGWWSGWKTSFTIFRRGSRACAIPERTPPRSTRSSSGSMVG